MNKNNNKKIALVLDGGGAKGAYHIGVFKALKELDIIKYITAISGASVGALNACLFPIYNLNSQIVENIWINEVEDKILTLNPNKVINSLLKIRKTILRML
ncbi:patatin-like phospholipase family protein [Brachyspira hampsonii]|uniref:patatin-like phospholipase family protein n=1 Tax=Brachyspira hampsonii TaxID=1287055 RepID=UPI000D3433F5|nr:patatin-like phospholipase family protein [Brachyspira hampsonii]